MIKLINIKKEINGVKILDDLSYSFDSKGFYVIMGESGCGKTTLLNILAGLIPFSGGTAELDGTAYENVFNGIECYDYITQDSYFADFLTVCENLEAVRDDKDRIISTLSGLGIEKLRDSYPGKLSGGEKQRLAIARALLSDSTVFFMDEPTASLDRKNKTEIFNILKRLGEEKLIICATHDKEAGQYADHILRLTKCTGNGRSDDTCTSAADSPHPQRKQKTESPFRYIKKWFSRGTQIKKANRRLTFILAAVFCVCFLADLPRNKLDSTIDNLYGVNALTLRTYSTVRLSELPERDKIKEYQPHYAGSVPAPTTAESEDGVVMPSDTSYELTSAFISPDPDLFRLADTVEYGSYMTEKNHVVLSYDYAENIAKGNHASLVGQPMEVTLYGVGKVSLTVSGVFGKWNGNEEKYVRALELQTFDYYLNSELIAGAADDESFCFENGQRSYILLFKNYKSAKEYLNRNREWFEERDHELDFSASLTLSSTYDSFIYMCIALLPLAVLVSLFAVIFYTTTVHTELSHNNAFLSVFDYMGYPYGKIKSCFIALQMKRLALNIAASLAASIVFSVIANIINKYAVFFPFQLFTYNPLVIAGLIVLLTVSAFISIRITLRKIGRKNWYDNLTEERDLL